MYYYKYLKAETLVSLLTFEKSPRLTEGLVEITEEEYNKTLAEIASSIPKSEEPSYEELMEAYTILTGGEEIE